MNVKTKIIECLESVGIFINTYDEDVCINDYGVDSLMLISIILRIEDEFSICIPDENLSFETLSSLNGFSQLIESLIYENV